MAKQNHDNPRGPWAREMLWMFKLKLRKQIQHEQDHTVRDVMRTKSGSQFLGETK